MSTHDKKPPIAKFNDRGINIKLWERKTSTDKVYINASIEKTYKDKDGNYQKSYSFNSDDLMRLQTLIPQAREAMQHNYQQLKEEQKSAFYEKDNDKSLAQQRDEVMQKAEQNQKNTQSIEHNYKPEYDR